MHSYRLSCALVDFDGAQIFPAWFLNVLARSNLDPTVSGDITDRGSPQTPPQTSRRQRSKIERLRTRLEEVLELSMRVQESLTDSPQSCLQC